MGRREGGGQSGQAGQVGRGAQMGSSAWHDGMTAVNGSSAPLGASMPGTQGVQMGRSATDATQGALGGDIGDGRGNSVGHGLSQGNRVTGVSQAGQQTQSHFDRGNGATEAGGRSQMAADGHGQAHGASGARGGGRPGEQGDPESQGGQTWGNAAGGALMQAPPAAAGPLGHDVDPGGHPRELAPLAQGARGWMVPGVAQQGAPTGPTMDAPVAPGSLLPGAPGDGALAGAGNEDPEQTMVTQRVPPSLRAYVRRYFQGIQAGASAGPGRSP
jgi:hypothetical protein